MKKHSSMSDKKKLVGSSVKKSFFADARVRKSSDSVESSESAKLESPSTVDQNKKTRNKMTLKSTANITRSKPALAENNLGSASFFNNDQDLKDGYDIWLEQSEKMSTQISHLQFENEILKRRVKGGTELTEEEKKKNATIAEQNEKITELLVENGQLKLKYNCLEKEFEDYQKIIEEKIGEDDEELKNELKQKEQRIAELENLLQSIENKNKILLEKYEILKQEKEALRSDEVAVLAKSCKEFEEINKIQESTISQLEDDIRFLQENNEELQSQVSEWKFIADKYNQQIESAEKAKKTFPGAEMFSSDTLKCLGSNLDSQVCRFDSLQRSLEQIQEQLVENYEYSLTEDRKRRDELSNLIQNQTVCQDTLLESVNYLKSIEQTMSSDHPLGLEGSIEEQKPVVIVESLETGLEDDIRARQSTEEVSSSFSRTISKPTCVGSAKTETQTGIKNKKSSKATLTTLCMNQLDLKKELGTHKIKAISKNFVQSWESVRLLREAGEAACSRLNSLFSQL